MKTKFALMAILSAILCLMLAEVTFAKQQTLWDACNEEDYNKVQKLIENGANVNKADEDGLTPLAITACNGNTKIIELLLKNNAEVNGKGKTGDTALMPACFFGNVDAAKLLLEHGADVNASNEDGYSPLYFASFSKNENIEIVKLLIDNKADINKPSKKGITPLMTAMLSNNKNIASLLIKHNADVNNIDADGWTILHYAAFAGYDDIFKSLLKNNIDINAKTKNGKTSLMLASEKGHKDVAQTIIDNGAEINIEDNEHNTALSLAIRNRHKDVAELLESKGGIIPEGANVSAWNERRDKSPMDDSEQYFAQLSSEDKKTTLILRCSENKSEAYIRIDKYMGLYETTVEYRFDSEKALKRSWSLSTNNKSVFAPKPIDFMKKLAKSKKLTVRVTPYNDSPMISIFELDGVDKIVDNISQICKWKK